MERIRQSEDSAACGWIIVAGGWTPPHLAEKRRQTRAELTAAAPANPVCPAFLFQHPAYARGGFAALNIASDEDVFRAASWCAMRKAISPAAFQATSHNLAGANIHRKDRGATGRNE